MVTCRMPFGVVLSDVTAARGKNDLLRPHEGTSVHGRTSSAHVMHSGGELRHLSPALGNEAFEGLWRRGVHCGPGRLDGNLHDDLQQACCTENPFQNPLDVHYSEPAYCTQICSPQVGR